MLKERGYSRQNSAIQKVLPTYDQLLSNLKDIKDYTKDITREDYSIAKAIEDYIKINVNYSYIKLSNYYKATSKILVYYTTIVLHLRHKLYYQNIQADRQDQLTDSNTLLKKLQVIYKN